MKGESNLLNALEAATPSFNLDNNNNIIIIISVAFIV